MATSLLPVTLPGNTFVDLYAATGIVVGTKLLIQNTGSSEALLTESLAEPSSINAVGFNSIPPRLFLTNDDTAVGANVGAWAFAKTGSTLQVEEA